MHKLAKLIIDSRKIILVLFIAAACMSAYTMRLTTVQNDLYQFLPAETETRRGLKAMDGEFITFATADLMIEHISYDDALALSPGYSGNRRRAPRQASMIHRSTIDPARRS